MTSAIDLNLFLCMFVKMLFMIVVRVIVLSRYIHGVATISSKLLAHYMLASTLLLIPVTLFIPIARTPVILHVRVLRVTSAVRKMRVKTS